jgi:hypothetical protein
MVGSSNNCGEGGGIVEICIAEMPRIVLCRDHVLNLTLVVQLQSVFFWS